MGKDRKPLGLLALLAVCAILASAVIAVNVDARGANASGKKGGGGGTTSTATCSFTPNQIALGASTTFSASGFPANTVVGVTVSWSTGQGSFFFVADGTGSYSSTYVPNLASTYYFSLNSGAVKATCTLQVT